MNKTVSVHWLRPDEGGRKVLFPGGKYYPVAVFPNEVRSMGAWSVVLDLTAPDLVDGRYVSTGSCRYLVQAAPEHNFDQYDRFDIFEGPKKVARAFLT